jgi:hypothetical protein
MESTVCAWSAPGRAIRGAKTRSHDAAKTREGFADV